MKSKQEIRCISILVVIFQAYIVEKLEHVCMVKVKISKVN